jgi:hypothetical protein
MDAADGRCHGRSNWTKWFHGLWHKKAEAVHIWRQIRPATKLTRMLSIDDLFKGRSTSRKLRLNRTKTRSPAE